MKNRIIYLILFLMLLGMNTKVFAQVQNITITRKVNSDKSVDLLYEKKMPGSYYINIEFSNLNNCQESDFKGTVSGFNGVVMKIRSINPQQNINFSFRYSSMMGDLNPKVDSLFQYVLPFKNGKKVKIFEAGNIGEKFLESEKPVNWTSYIVKLKNPDTIYSMRKGIVVKLIDDYDEDSSVDRHYTSKTNSITIEHEDGTLGRYIGFKRNSFKVKLGQTVYPQTELGIIELFNKEENVYRFNFSIYYLFDGKINTSENQSFKGLKSKYKYITPYFITQEGLIKIESKKEYTTSFNEAIFLKELSRSEKKKFAKDSSQLK